MGTSEGSPEVEPGGQLTLDQLETAAVAGGTGDGSDGTRTRGLRRDRSEVEGASEETFAAFPSGMIHLPPGW